MSLQEFLGDDTLGDSVWNEDDINLDAISNTTSIDVLKNKTQKQQQQQEGRSDAHHPFGYRSPPSMDGHPSSFAPAGPPYIVKFSQLPPRFADGDIHDLFHEKFTKFVKFKLFWELNANPSIAVLNSGSVFDQNFKRENKVAFVELYSGRDMDKILKYWTTPMLKLYNIKVEPAEFSDFNEYMAKVKLLTDPKDDAAKPYVPLQASKANAKPAKPKPNPFGSAKPVDTQSKILDIEEKVGKLHVEDTSTLRRISASEPSSQHPGKVTLLKKPHEENNVSPPAAASSALVDDPPAKPLSYLQVIKKTAEESKKSPSTSSATTRISSPATQSASLEDGAQHSALEDGESFEDTDYREGRPFHKRNSFSDNGGSMRAGRGGSRGGNSFRRGGARGGGGGGGGGGGRGGTGSRYQNDNRRGGAQGHNSHNQPFHQQDGSKHIPEEKRYSMFKPASGFLWENGNDKTANGQNQRGGHYGRGSYRGRGNRRGRGFSTA
ncbi:related to protein PSP2 [Zygosaccharomyces bailii]|nr:related to Protein PSP2 [Zygosaccharomyces bailii ISA1307]SJM87123.1 related to protein PSP2 [Zygosaccharomyces bailii]